MPGRLRFGIPSLDKLFGEASRGMQSAGVITDQQLKKAGILIPGCENPNSLRSSVSMCISGPDGTGKSVLGMHLASTYIKDCYYRRESDRRHEQGQWELPKVLYISTDLRYKMARKMWLNFGLDWPSARRVPFTDESLQITDEDLQKTHPPEVILRPCLPLGKTSLSRRPPKLDEAQPLAQHLSKDGPEAEDEQVVEVLFVDLAAVTAGDDWGFVNRVLSVLDPLQDGQPCHLLVIDSVEGFETLVGERDAFGERQSRRSRIAQIMRSAADKCHTLFIVEEPEESKHLPEEFVADVVIRLRSSLIKDYVRRTLEIEKARGHAHVRGQHVYLIRSGSGSTTGRQENYDDPKLPAITQKSEQDPQHERAPFQGYLHVCHSLHYLNREIMALEGKGRPATLPARFAAFGIRYLDDMLDGNKEVFKRTGGDDQRGLRCGTTTALIGNAETQKSPLGTAFLSRCFRTYAETWYGKVEDLEKYPAKLPNLLKRLEETEQQLKGKDLARLKGNYKRMATVFRRLEKVLSLPLTGLDAVVGEEEKRLRQKLFDLARITDEADKPYGSYIEPEDFKRPGDKQIIKEARQRGWLKHIAPEIRALAWEMTPPQWPQDGIPVLLTTQDVHAQKLAHDFMPWLMRKVWRLKQLDEIYPGCLAALRILMEEYTICRRLEIHDLPPAVLIHTVQQAVEVAQRILHGRTLEAETEQRFNQSWGIRVVIDDFSILKNSYIEIREEPLLLRFLIFYLGREGVTSLLIDTQSGRPDTLVANPLENEMRSLVDQHLYTWRFSFYGENRVAIAAIPPISPRLPAVIRELRRGALGSTEPDATPLVVDPHFELYSGIELGEPKPIPLEIRLFEETPAFKRYIEQEEPYYREWFTPLPKKESGEGGHVIVGIPADEYDRLRDFSYLQRDTRLDHTKIFQVDEFWEMLRPHLRRAGAFRPQWRYLSVATTVKTEERETQREWAVDPSKLFQQTVWEIEQSVAKDEKWHRRAQEFEWHGYAPADIHKFQEEKEGLAEQDEIRELVDRVPFMWDFGFLLCKVRPWQLNGARELSFWKKRRKEESKKKLGAGFAEEKWEEDWAQEEFHCVNNVWEALPKATEDKPPNCPRPSWRVFLEACYQVAKAQTRTIAIPVAGFDLHIITSQTLACLIFEIWASEIYQSESLEQQREKVLLPVAQRRWKHQDKGLIDWLSRYRKELFKTWLLLIEVLDMPALAAAIRSDNSRLREPNPAAITVRHWYKTACRFTENLSLDDPVVPISLPGHFSVRGDWFLAVAGGSRSGRLADRALDLLSSRRAQHERLQFGLGLPTRKLVTETLLTNITGLDWVDESHSHKRDIPPRIRKVLYEQLVKIGVPRPDHRKQSPTTPEQLQEFNWFWRSGLAHYHRHTRIWQDWLGKIVLWWERMRQVNPDNWMNGFQRYDEIDTEQPSSDYFKRTDLNAWKDFEGRCELLIQELKDATLASAD